MNYVLIGGGLFLVGLLCVAKFFQLFLQVCESGEAADAGECVKMIALFMCALFFWGQLVYGVLVMYGRV